MTGRPVSVWSYPWDLHDLGLAAACERLAEAGATMVSLATSYHAGRFVQPGNPRRRVYFPEDGTVYYRPDPGRWAGREIVPLPARIVDEEGDMLARLLARRAAGGLAVGCWTVCLHNTRLGMLHPDHVLRTAHGDPHLYALCPSSPAARAYATGLVAEIAARGPDRIELETPEFMGFAHGFHHEKDGVGLLPEDEFLLGLCFCRHCLDRARAAGVDGRAAQRRVAALLDAALARELPRAVFPDFPEAGAAAFDREPEIAAWIAWRREPVTSLLAEMRAAAGPGVELLLVDFAGSWMGGVDLPAAAAAVDGLLHCAYTVPPGRIGALLSGLRRAIGPGRRLIAGFQLFHPTVRDADDLAARVAAAAPHADGFNFYNLGLVPPARLGWIARALGAPAG
jgi:hypothetical protein